MSFFCAVHSAASEAADNFPKCVAGGNETVIIFELTRCGENYSRLFFNTQIYKHLVCRPCTNHRNNIFFLVDVFCCCSFREASKFLSHMPTPVHTK